MSPIKRNVFKRGPRSVKKSLDAREDKYPVKKPARKTDEFREEKDDGYERRPASRTHSFDRRDRYIKKEREPLSLKRATGFTAAMPEPLKVHAAGDSGMQPVTAYKLRKGLAAAQKEILETIEDVSRFFAESRHIRELELDVSFSAEGQFLGFGRAGAATIKIKINPEDL